jgi:hypothetical protein
MEKNARYENHPNCEILPNLVTLIGNHDDDDIASTLTSTTTSTLTTTTSTLTTTTSTMTTLTTRRRLYVKIENVAVLHRSRPSGSNFFPFW